MKRTQLRLVIAAIFVLLTVSAAHAGFMRGGHFTLDELYSAIRAVEQINPELVTIEEYGKSVEGRPLLVIKMARPDGRDRAEALVYGTVHAHEWAGGRVALAIAEKLAREADPWVSSLLERMDFYVIPLMNPDGYAVASRHLDLGFTWARDNAHHVDLNRNWPQAKQASIDSAKGVALGGSSFKWNPHYRGPHPLSEPENIALDKLVQGHKFFIAFDLHTVGGRFSYPWSSLEQAPPDKDIFEAVGHEMQKHQKKYAYLVHQSYSWYQILGASKDWFYGKYGVLAVTVEVGKTSEFNKKKIGIRLLNPFYQYNDIDAQTWIENDGDALLRAIEKAYELTGGTPRPPMEMEWLME